MNSRQVDGTQTVVQSPAMVAPEMRDMLTKREYPTQKEPPMGHARLWGDPDRAIYCLTYNGCDILTIQYPAGAESGLRFHSDGDYQSEPFIQQAGFSARTPSRVVVTIAFPGEWIAMRARRAVAGEAIWGQLGNPLIYGADAAYALEWDLLVSWHGYHPRWLGRRVEREGGMYVACMELTLTSKPLIFVLRPRYYSSHLGYRGHRPWERRIDEKPVAGWCSWEAHHSTVTEADVDAAARAVAQLKPYGLAYMQLDDGYQNTLVPPREGASVTESWLSTNEKFPGGHEAIVSAMRGGGFVPGIWTNATLTNGEALEGEAYVLRDARGKLIKGDWIQYVLDCTEDTLKKQVEPTYRALREAGYDYFKIDSIRHLIYDGLDEGVRLGLMDSATARDRHRAFLLTVRKGIGEDAYLLSCWGTLCSAIGICDAMRVSTDSNPRFSAISMQLREMARWYFAQRVLFTIDPDLVCVRSKLNWVRMALSIVSLAGGLYMISDQPEVYEGERLDMVRRTLPPLATRAAETGPIDYASPACWPGRWGMDDEQVSRDISHYADEDHPFASLWCVHIDQGGRQWSVVQRCGAVALPEADAALPALGLDPEVRYYAFDFWAQKGWLLTEGTLKLRALALGDTQVVALTPIEGKYQLIGSDRHVSCDAVSVDRIAGGEDGLTLFLRGFAGLEARYFIYAPDAECTVVRAEGCRCECGRDGELMEVKVWFEADQAAVSVR